MRSEAQDSLHLPVESTIPMCSVKRPNHSDLDDNPSKRRKLELPPPHKQLNSRSIGYSEIEALPEEVEPLSDLLMDLEENNSHKLQYQELCKAYESKSADIEGLLESSRGLEERTVEMELRLLKEKVSTRKLIRGIT